MTVGDCSPCRKATTIVAPWGPAQRCQAGLTKRVTSHTLCHSFAAHLPADGYDIRTVRELLGHSDVKTTMIYTHVPNRGGRGVHSPAEGIGHRTPEG